jgi:hypothetical protein
MKISFNIGLVKIESHIVSKNNIYMTTLFDHHNLCSPNFVTEMI